MLFKVTVALLVSINRVFSSFRIDGLGRTLSGGKRDFKDAHDQPQWPVDPWGCVWLSVDSQSLTRAAFGSYAYATARRASEL